MLSIKPGEKAVTDLQQSFVEVTPCKHEKTCCVEAEYSFFGKDFETYFRSALPNYCELENRLSNDYQITTKPGKAKAVAQHASHSVDFIQKLIEQLSIMELVG